MDKGTEKMMPAKTSICSVRKGSAQSRFCIVLRIIVSFRSCFHEPWLPGYLGIRWDVIHVFSAEARTRGFVSLTSVRFAFIDVTELGAVLEKPRQFGDVRKWESILEDSLTVRSGSQANSLAQFTPTAANGQKRTLRWLAKYCY
jgi:hypothetical protein